MLSVGPDTLSGAFGWPPSSGDGAILESVRRSEIISGRRRQRPRRLGGRGSRNCAVLPCTGSSSSLLEISATLRLLQLLLLFLLSLSAFISDIYYIYTHRTLLLYQLLRAILLLLLAAAAVRECFFTLLFDFGGFFFLNYCATKLLLVATTCQPA